MHSTAIGPIAIHLPEKVEDNDFLGKEFPRWNMDLIYEKTGIFARHIAAPNETAGDLGVAASEKLFEENNIDPGTIDFLLLCTQTPDYPLPTTSCLMQDQLKLPTSCGTLDFNLGCSGFVYGLSLADGLIRAGSAKRVLLVTAETYSKYIDPADRSLRTIFGDGAAATLIEPSEEDSLGSFVFGTDGAGGNALMVAEGGARLPEDALQPSKRKRWDSSLYMDGPELIKFGLDVVPDSVERVLKAAGWKRDDVDLYLMHQATLKMLEHLRSALRADEEQAPEALRDCGNTVSSTIPLMMDELRKSGKLKPGMQSLMLGFGVGLSWAGCVWTETYQMPKDRLDSPAASSAEGSAVKSPVDAVEKTMPQTDPALET